MAKDITTKSIAKDMDRFFNSFFAADRKIPSVNISETDTGYEIKAALAGYDEDSISLSMKRNWREDSKGYKHYDQILVWTC